MKRDGAGWEAVTGNNRELRWQTGVDSGGIAERGLKSESSEVRAKSGVDNRSGEGKERAVSGTGGDSDVASSGSEVKCMESGGGVGGKSGRRGCGGIGERG